MSKKVKEEVEDELLGKIKELSYYRYALDESSIIAITDQKGIINHVNDNFCKISKYSREELLGKDHRIINSGYHKKEFIKYLWRTIAQGKIWKGELKNRAKDGTAYWVDTTIVPFLDNKGKPYQYVAIRSDITERKKAEEELLKKIKEISDYKYALDESSIVAITDQKGIITHVNDNFCKISKYSREELLGQDHRIINSAYHSSEFIKELWQTIANGKVWKGELKNKAKDGTAYWVDTTIVPFLNEHGKPYQYVAIRSDISERKKGEEKIAKMLINTEYQNKQLVDFCNIVSHNLRAPLVNISMLLDYAESTEDQDEKTEVLKRVKPVINHLNGILDELVESLQVRQDSEIESNIINLKETTEKTLVAFEGQIKLYKAKIRMDFSEVNTIFYPQRYIDSILTNLISNALKYKSPDRNITITIKTRNEPDGVVLSIADNGLGIDLELHKHNMFKIRKVFHKHPESKGFGLFMTKTQVEAMGGHIWVDSTPNKGSTFYIQFKPQPS
ncbi:PAS domain-containing sensor histidine kinase [Flavobacterium sp. J49]|uniref:PAS domain-containing sensor histidine kinase n=1 Tax=Flavobacterium sp. J49 TaxID=2718534 RepID=UPI001594D85F|nr:PAS domain-containing sensor histidine kinase [Flavobacterium sp. J49]MBF6641985.1 PAS domain-containing sensor histidine kinase [Flavobacterium sp. J49]NIC03233.1 PAS domain-containing sensor histidine kinase [Flavobacterium sp. J49]